MGRYSGYLICSDFDGTLAEHTVVPQGNIDAIKYFCDNGGSFAVVSGRGPEFLKDYAEQLCLGFVGCINGSVIYSITSDRIVKKTFLPEDAIEKITAFLPLLENIYDVNVFTAEGNKCLHGEDINDLISRVTDCFALPVYKILLHRVEDITNEEISLAKRIFGEKYEIARSWSRSIEISNIASHKGCAAREIAELVGAHTLICVGDYENDIPLLQSADISYAVGNALPELKKIADRITVSVGECAIKKIIEEI